MTTTYERITFTRKECAIVETTVDMPRYGRVINLPNSCGAIAGATVVDYYNSYFDGFVTGLPKSNVCIAMLICELYALMRTNVRDVGVSKTDCLIGLKAFVNGKGRSLTYADVRSRNTVNEASFVKAINNNHPVLLFCNNFDLCEFNLRDDADIVEHTLYQGGHVCVANGLYTVKYYVGNALLRIDKYLRVATGLPQSIGYLKLDTPDWCDGAYEVIIR